MSRTFPPFDSIIQDLAKKLEVEVVQDSLLCNERMAEQGTEITNTSSDKRRITEEKNNKFCSVCGDYASGFHYKCWTCEGCKGFFRRSIKKHESYTCEWENKCVVDRLSRTLCMKCRYQKCLAVGMVPNTPESVPTLPSFQVMPSSSNPTKYVVRESNITPISKTTIVKRRYTKHVYTKRVIQHNPANDLLGPIVRAYRETFTRVGPSRSNSLLNVEDTNSLSSLHMGDLLTPTITKVITFARAITGFNTFSTDDQIYLLAGSCMEILCLRVALRFNVEHQGFHLRGDRFLTQSDILTHPELGMLSPLFSYAQRIAELKLDEAETAILMAIWTLQSSRPELREPEGVEVFQESIMNVSKSYAKNGAHSSDELRWLKTLMARCPPLRGITVHTLPNQSAVYLLIEHVATLPISFMHLFEEDE